MIRLRNSIRRSARPTVLALLGLLSAAVLLAHSPMTTAHHAAMDNEPVNQALSACLAVLEIVSTLALFVVAWRPQLFRASRRREPRTGRGAQTLLLLALPPAARARAGPAELQVFRL